MKNTEWEQSGESSPEGEWNGWNFQGLLGGHSKLVSWTTCSRGSVWTENEKTTLFLSAIILFTSSNGMFSSSWQLFISLLWTVMEWTECIFQNKQFEDIVWKCQLLKKLNCSVWLKNLKVNKFVASLIVVENFTILWIWYGIIEIFYKPIDSKSNQLPLISKANTNVTTPLWFSHDFPPVKKLSNQVFSSDPSHGKAD